MRDRLRRGVSVAAATLTGIAQWKQQRKRSESGGGARPPPGGQSLLDQWVVRAADDREAVEAPLLAFIANDGVASLRSALSL